MVVFTSSIEDPRWRLWLPRYLYVGVRLYGWGARPKKWRPWFCRGIEQLIAPILHCRVWYACSRTNFICSTNMVELCLEVIAKEKRCHWYDRWTQHSVVFVETWLNAFAAALCDFKTHMPKQCQCVGIHSDKVIRAKFGAVSFCFEQMFSTL